MRQATRATAEPTTLLPRSAPAVETGGGGGGRVELVGGVGMGVAGMVMGVTGTVTDVGMMTVVGGSGVDSYTVSTADTMTVE